MFPEGTRSSDGRLRALKKGIVHLAIHTRLPIVPVVTTGAHRAWGKGSLRLRKAPIKVAFLDRIPTDDWSEDRIEEHLETIRQALLSALPADQQPVPPPASS